MQIPNINRCLLSINVESVLKFFKHFNQYGVWSSGVGFWCLLVFIIILVIGKFIF